MLWPTRAPKRSGSVIRAIDGVNGTGRTENFDPGETWQVMPINGDRTVPTYLAQVVDLHSIVRPCRVFFSAMSATSPWPDQSSESSSRSRPSYLQTRPTKTPNRGGYGSFLRTPTLARS